MQTQNLTLLQFADLLKSESEKGIINGGAVIGLIANAGIPKIIYDIRGAVRLMVDKAGDHLLVTEYSTDFAEERIAALASA
jgi:hypothetical protein